MTNGAFASVTRRQQDAVLTTRGAREAHKATMLDRGECEPKALCWSDQMRELARNTLTRIGTGEAGASSNPHDMSINR